MVDQSPALGRRIVVTGLAGSGKSTFSLALAAATDLPVIHLDLHFWQPGWVEPTDSQWRATQQRVLAGAAWIADGNYHETLDLRLERADTVVVLDTPWWRCAGRALVRGFRMPDELPPGCDYPRRQRLLDEWQLAARVCRVGRSEPRLEREIIARHGGHAAVHVLRSKRAVAELLESRNRSGPGRDAGNTAAIGPSQFYTGIVAELYAPLRSAAPDPDVYAGFIGAVGEPALELGCGDGDPIIDLRVRGLDVEGVDSSQAMLERCRAAAAARDVEVVVHLQRMQDLDLPRRFRSIYLAGATFNLLPTDDDALEALRRIRSHLDVGGAALVPLFLPTPTGPERLGQAVEATDPDGAVIRVTPMSERRDDDRRIQETVMRYERITADDHDVEDRPWTIHWHMQEGFRALAAAAGLRTAAVLDEHGAPASPDDSIFAFWLEPDG